MRKIITAIVAGVTVLALGVGVFIYQSLEKTVTLTIDGVPTQVSTLTTTVGALLADEGIEPGEHDLVAPAPDTRLNDGTRISVRYGRPVTITVDGRTDTHWTTGTSVGEVLDLLEIKSAGADMSASRSRSVGRDGLTFTIDTAKTVTILTAGESQEWQTTATSVGSALTDLGVEVGGDDIVIPNTATALGDGATIRVVKVANKTETETEAIGHKTVEKKNANLERGATRVEQAGRNGEKTLTYRVVSHDGEQISRELEKEEVTTQPVDRIVQVGTKAPAPKQSTSGSSGSSGSSSSGSSAGSSGGSSSAPPVSSGSAWDRLAQCESGGNWSINTGNGYYGGLQFSAQSWRAVGGTGLPHQHSREEQILRGEKLKAIQGWGAWPACSRKLGLR